MSVINSFPGYEFVQLEDKRWHNMYRGVDLGFGGYVYSQPGIHYNVALMDIQSMHPNSAVNLNYFGEYTQRFKDILDARIAIKNRDFDKARKMFNGMLAGYLVDEESADQLAQALKIAINSVYGLTSAKFDNPFRDPRNKNNIVALRGALFMKTLQDEVTARGYTVAHIKTDSIKIPDATPEIIAFCHEFAAKYGYVFEHEATYERMCLIDDAQYIAAYMRPEDCEKRYGYSPKDNVKQFKKHNHSWTATGAAFQHPYIFKTLFSGEGLIFDDYCETKSVTGGAIYLDTNEGFPDVTAAEEERDRRIYNSRYPDKKPKRLNPAFSGMDDEALANDIAKGHRYAFIGRVGRFYPVRPGVGGGLMVREKDGRYYSVTGTKGYRWMEAEAVKTLGLESCYDPKYFAELISGAIAQVNEFGDFASFVDIRGRMDMSRSVVPCGDGKRTSCVECPQCSGDICESGYDLSGSIAKGGEVA